MGGQVRLQGAPTRGGRIGLHITGDSVGHFAVNISLPEDFTWPVGGLVLRLRTPAFPAKKISCNGRWQSAVPEAESHKRSNSSRVQRAAVSGRRCERTVRGTEYATEVESDLAANQIQENSSTKQKVHNDRPSKSVREERSVREVR